MEPLAGNKRRASVDIDDASYHEFDDVVPPEHDYEGVPSMYDPTAAAAAAAAAAASATLNGEVLAVRRRGRKPREKRGAHVCLEEGCGKVFAKHKALINHLKWVHIGDKMCVEWLSSALRGACGRLPPTALSYLRSFPCSHPGCGKAFTRTDHLANHVKTHTGDKPYLCRHEGCNKTFSLAHNLTSHMRTHTGERPYICDAEG
jgi:hypothetical protein